MFKELIATRRKFQKTVSIIELANGIEEAKRVFDVVAYDLQIMLIKLHTEYDAIDTKLIADDGKLGYAIRMFAGSHTYNVSLQLDLLTKQWSLKTTDEVAETSFTSGRSINLGTKPEPTTILKQLQSLPELRMTKS